MTSEPEPEVLLSLRGISKRFAGTLALNGVDFDLLKGEVHALFGENGAGKSTLINIIAGSYPHDAGQYHYRGETISHPTPSEAKRLGIAAVFQEFSLVPTLTVEENIFLGREKTSGIRLDKVAMRKRVRELLDSLDFHISERAKVGDLSRAQQQMVEIAKALAGNPGVLIFDEPTASLTEVEAEQLFRAVSDLRARGVGMIYVSHRLAELHKLADRITVLRGGQKVGTLMPAEATRDRLVEMMVGRPVTTLFPPIAFKPGNELLEVRNLVTVAGTVRDVSLNVRAGEIVGLAGLVGCGKGAVGRAIFGIDALAAGEVIFRGKKLATLTPHQLLDVGVCYFPSDRAAEGLTLNRRIIENMSMAALDRPEISRHGVLKLVAEAKAGVSIGSKLNLRPGNIQALTSTLSGGNRQKVMLARGLIRPIELFIFDEPTVGIDVGAKAEIYALMRDLVERERAGVLLISSDLPEIIHLSSRMYVMHEGRIVADLQTKDSNEAGILSNYFGRSGFEETAAVQVMT